MSAREADRKPPRGGRIALAALLLVLSIYPGAYAHARLTHRLVNYGSFIARPHAMSGIGYSPEELVFAPWVALEELLRGM